MPARNPLAALTGLLAGCAVHAADYPASRAAMECDLYDRCGLLSAFGDSYEQCTEVLTAQEEDRVSAEGCDYSRVQARRCIASLSEASCDDLREAETDEASPCEMVCG